MSKTKTKVEILRELCLKVTGKASDGKTVNEVLQDIADNYPAQNN